MLALRAYFPVGELASFDQVDSRLQGHPDMLLTPGVDASTGSLGQGLSAGCGMALGAKRLGKDLHTWVMLGDGELEEGMVWESVLCAPRYQLDNLTAIIDVNGLHQYGWPATAADRFDRSEPTGHVDLPAVFRGFGRNTISVDGHDLSQILPALDQAAAYRGVTPSPPSSWPAPRRATADGDLATSTRADIVADAHPESFIQVGIAEQNMVGMAFGLSTLGYRPWVSSFGVFLTNRALDRVRMLVSQTRAPIRLQRTAQRRQRQDAPGHRRLRHYAPCPT